MVLDAASVEAVVELVPAWLAILLAVLSQLGSVYFVVPLVVGAYVLDRSRRTAAWLGVLAGSYGLMLALKALFTVSRPGVDPPLAVEAVPVYLVPLYAPAVEVSTKAFPSGHVLVGTVVWGLLALELDRGTFPQRVAVASVIVGLVSVSRVALGVHYPVDVVVGFLCGLAYLGVVVVILERSRTPVVTLGVLGIATATAAILAGYPDAATVAGVSYGGLAAWLLLGRSPIADPGTRPVTSVGLFGVLVAAAVPLGFTVDPLTAGRLVAGTVAGMAIVFLPVAVSSVTGRQSVLDHETDV